MIGVPVIGYDESGPGAGLHFGPSRCSKGSAALGLPSFAPHVVWAPGVRVA